MWHFLYSPSIVGERSDVWIDDERVSKDQEGVESR